MDISEKCELEFIKKIGSLHVAVIKTPKCVAGDFIQLKKIGLAHYKEIILCTQHPVVGEREESISWDAEKKLVFLGAPILGQRIILVVAQ